MNKKRNLAFGLVFALLVGLMVVPTFAATIEVPDDYDSITEALAAAEPGDTIEVYSGYDSSNETFPILVQKDDVTIDGNGNLIEEGDQSPDNIIGRKAIFAVGGLWAYDDDDPDTYEPTTYRKKSVSGVTIRDFRIFEPGNGTDGDADVGFVLSNVSNVTIEDNVVDASDDDDTLIQGIRLIETVNSNVENNEFVGMGDDTNDPNGIGIFLQGPGTTDNLIEDNGVFDSGLGLFIFEAVDNEIDGDAYADNYYGGVVVNDSSENLLRNLSVEGNAGWGVRFVHSNNNTLQESWIEKNGYGGVELIASDGNKVDSNVTYDNGTADTVERSAQIAVTKGEKGLVMLEEQELEVTPEEFVHEKEKLVAKMDLLEEWLHELNLELEQVAKDVGDSQTNSAMARLRTIVGDIAIANGGSDFGKISLATGEVFKYKDAQDREAILLDTMMEDPTKNFTLEDAETEFDYQGVLDKDDLDKFAGGTSPGGGANWGERDAQDDFGLNYENDEYSWDKLSILYLITDAAKHEFYNNFESDEYDSLWEKIEYFYNNDWITQQDYDDLSEKVFGASQADLSTENGAIGYLNAILDQIDPSIMGAIEDLYSEIDAGTITTYQGANEFIENNIDPIKSSISNHVDQVRKDLNRIDLEVPPLPRVEPTLVEKKEKPFTAIDTSEDGEFPFSIDTGSPATDTLLDGLGGSEVDPLPVTLEEYVTGVLHSEGNVISSNVITTDQGTNEYNAGILLETGDNVVVNNTITNERLEPIDDEPAYGQEFHALDVGIYLLSNNNRLAYNAIEFINTGIIRGGYWEHPDYQLDYDDVSYPLVAYWPGPGFHVEDEYKEYDKAHFEERPTYWVPVHTVSSGDLQVGYTSSQNVKRNKLALNFFDHGGIGIDIVDAESNEIFGNLFYKLENADMYFRENLNIQLYDNDHYGVSGTDSVHNTTDLNVDASDDYTPAEGEDGHTTTEGNVSPPAASNPQAYDNFGTSTKFDDLNIGSYFPGASADEQLPPNLDEYLRNDVVLPGQKPRHPDDVFGPDSNGGGGEGTCFSVSGLWNMVSMPVAPSDSDPNAVFDEVPGTLYLWEYPDGSGWNTVQDGTLTSVSVYGGYYLWLPSDTTVSQICTTGTSVTGDQSISLGTAGWRLFGVPYAVQWGDDGTIMIDDGSTAVTLPQAVNNGWISNQIWEYNSSTQSFETATVADDKTLDPSKGYWVYTQVGNLDMNFSQSGSPGGPPTPSAAAVNLENVEKVKSNPPVPVEPAGDFSVDALEVKAVSQAETVTFQVSGEGAGFVNGVKVEVFDAGGRKVKVLESGGNTVEWSTSSVANGVYLYVASVNANGAYSQTNIGKLLLLK